MKCCSDAMLFMGAIIVRLGLCHAINWFLRKFLATQILNHRSVTEPLHIFILKTTLFPPFFLLSPMLTSIKKPSLSKPPWSDPRFCFADCCSCQACSPPSCLLCKLAGGFVDSRMGLFKTRGTPHPFTNRYTNNEMDYAGVPLFSFTPTWVFFAVPVGYCPE